MDFLLSCCYRTTTQDLDKTLKQCNVYAMLVIWPRTLGKAMLKWRNDQIPYSVSVPLCHAMHPDRTKFQLNETGAKMQQTRRIQNKTLANIESSVTNPHILMNKWNQKLWEKASQCFHRHMRDREWQQKDLDAITFALTQRGEGL